MKQLKISLCAVCLVLIVSLKIRMYTISDGLGLDMIFIQRVVCFISPSLVDGTEKTLNELDKITSNSKMDILRRNLHPALAVYNPKGVKTTLTNIHPNYLELDISTVSNSGQQHNFKYKDK